MVWTVDIKIPKAIMSHLLLLIYMLRKCVAMIFHETNMNKFMRDDRSGPGKTTIPLHLTLVFCLGTGSVVCLLNP